MSEFPKVAFFYCSSATTNTMCQQAHFIDGIPASAELQHLEDFLNLLVLLLHQGFAGDLMVRNIQLKHSGKYVCMVHTEVDTVSAAAELTVRGGWLILVISVITCNNSKANGLI